MPLSEQDWEKFNEQLEITARFDLPSFIKRIRCTDLKINNYGELTQIEVFYEDTKATYMFKKLDEQEEEKLIKALKDKRS